MGYTSEERLMAYYAVVFTRDFAPGEHWNDDAPADDSDRRQHWKVGELYSLGSQCPPTLPAHLAVVELDGPPSPGDTWDIAKQVFTPWTENKQFIADQVAAHETAAALIEAEIARLKQHL